MYKEKRRFGSQLYILIFTILIFGLWLVSFLAYNNFLEIYIGSLKLDMDWGVVVLGLLAVILLLSSNDCYYVGALVMFVPFVFAHPMSPYTVPVSLVIAIGLAIVGIILHLIIYRPKFSFGSFTIGITLLAIGMALGGLLTNPENFKTQLPIMVVICLVCMFAYLFFASNPKKHEFDELAKIMTCVGLLMVAQTIGYFWIYKWDGFLTSKICEVGWGCTNNLAMILLLCFPFTFYLTVNSRNIKSLFYMLLGFIEILGIVINYSRGAIIAMISILPITIIYCFIKSKSKLLYIIYLLIVLIAIGFGLYYFKGHYPDLWQSSIDLITKIDLSTLNGREAIYEELLGKVKDQPWFGHGMLVSVDSETDEYLWGHNVWIQTIYTMGIVGVGTIFIHMFEKYYKLFRNPSTSNICVALAFFASGIYGLADVGYYFVNYMVLLFLILAFIEHDVNPKYLDED